MEEFDVARKGTGRGPAAMRAVGRTAVLALTCAFGAAGGRDDASAWIDGLEKRWAFLEADEVLRRPGDLARQRLYKTVHVLYVQKNCRYVWIGLP